MGSGASELVPVFLGRDNFAENRVEGKRDHQVGALLGLTSISDAGIIVATPGAS